MAQARIPAVFYRGGTSKAVLFRRADLPADRELCDKIFCHVIGSPDPYKRQLDGMGGGLSSVSKVVIVEPSARDDADVDYTFVQIAVDEPIADYGSMCGNMSSSIGPFAVDEGWVQADGDEASVRVYNTNADALYTATFPVEDGQAIEVGDFEIPGVPGAGAKIKLDYFGLGGAITDALLPTGNVRDVLSVEGIGDIEVSMVDASNPVAFVRASDIGQTALESPFDLDADAELMAKLDQIRRSASVAMGMSDTPETAILSNPKIAMLGKAGEFTALDGRTYSGDAYDIAVRIVSMGNVHRAVTLTGAMCLATAVRIPGSIANELARESGTTLVGNPSGLLPVEAEVRRSGNGFEAVSATTYRTQRRIMEGAVLVPEELAGHAS
ncbi:MAG: PrpF domain-containing protein [Pseudomonadota bacterium]